MKIKLCTLWPLHWKNWTGTTRFLFRGNFVPRVRLGSSEYGRIPEVLVKPPSQDVIKNEHIQFYHYSGTFALATWLFKRRLQKRSKRYLFIATLGHRHSLWTIYFWTAYVTHSSYGEGTFFFFLHRDILFWLMTCSPPATPYERACRTARIHTGSQLPCCGK